MTTEERASGISPEMSEIDKLLEQIIERFEESDRESGDKGEQGERSKTNDRKKAEEMRKLSMEKLEKKKRRWWSNPKKKGKWIRNHCVSERKGRERF